MSRAIIKFILWFLRAEMPKKAFLCMSFLFLISSGFSSYLIFEGPPIQITNYGYRGDLVVGDDGRIHVVWHYSNTVFYKRYNPGSGWSNDTSLGIMGNYASIAIDMTGRVHVCAYYSTFYIYYKSCLPVGNGNAGWDASPTVLGTSSDGYKFFPSIACTPDTHVHIVFYRYRNTAPTGYMLGYYEKIGSTWQSLVSLDSSIGTNYHYYPSIAGGKANNDIHITWYGPRSGWTTYNQVWYLHRSSTGWDTVENVSNANYYQYLPTIDINFQNGYPYIQWTGGPTYPYRTIVKYRTSSGWSEGDTISEPGLNYYQYYGQIGAMKDGSMHGVWYGMSDSSAPNYAIRYNGSDTLGMNWYTPRDIAEGGGQPRIACDTFLNGHVIWMSGGIYYILGQPPKPNDVGVTNISFFPTYTVVQGDTVPVTITFKNFGLNTQTFIPVSYSVSGGRPATVIWIGSLGSGDSTQVTFGTPFVPSMVGQIPIKAWTALIGDQKPSNDTCFFTADVFIVGTRVGQLFNKLVFPPPGWQTNIIQGTEDWTRATISSYPSGYFPVEGFGMAHYNCYRANPPAQARLWTHKFNIGSGYFYDLIVDFWMFHTSAYSNDYDSLYLEYSYDSLNWVTVKGYRAYDPGNPIWLKHTDTLGRFSANLEMWVGFRAVSDWYHDIIVDSVRAFIMPYSYIDDVGIDYIQPFPKPMVAETSYPVTVRIKNYQIGAQTFIPVYYDPGDGSGTVQDTFIGILPGPPNQDTVYFTFSQPYTPANQGSFDFKSWTALANDIDTTNDTTTMSIMVCPQFHTAPFAKDFEEAWGPYGDNPPFCGWRIAYDSTPSTNDWHKEYVWWPSHGSNFAGITSSPVEDPSYDSLISPRFNFTGQAGVVLSCSTYWNPYDTGYLAEIKGSTDDGATYPYTIRTYPQSGATENIYETFNLPWAADQDFVRIAWIGTGNTDDIDYWAVDDILITSGPIIHDVGVDSILAPSGIIDSGAIVIPQAKVKYFGGGMVESFLVWFKILSSNELQTKDCQTLTVYQEKTSEKDKPNTLFNIELTADTNIPNDQVYEDSVWLTLWVGDSAIIGFRPWIPTVLDTYYLVSFTALPEETNPENDTAYGSVIVMRPFHDVGVVSILAPTDTVDSGAVVIPKAKVQNFGTNSGMFPVRFKIGNFYTDAAIINLQGGTIDTVEFTPWTAIQIGTHITKCTTLLAGDTNHLNDFIIDSITVLPRVGISEPANIRLLPKSFALENCLPNPFKDQTIIRYALPMQCQVDLCIYNSSGILVRTLQTGTEKVGFYRIIWNGRDEQEKPVAKGIYFYRLKAGDFKVTRKVVKLE